ncbi:15782_t:CDS:2 [Acaulospora morrowiae]|uniref:15782_t:CDS:1 n=1 Tax=Acaulospora morrowiae TaxID=94023 RepID=A0A9N9NDR7_9GLOM|nr:15782_t:CDS:2 [Acaulospora morrowiae]
MAEHQVIDEKDVTGKIKVTLSTNDSLDQSLAGVKIGGTQTVRWSTSYITGNPKVSIQVYSIFPTMPLPTYLEVWSSPHNTTLSEGHYQFTVDPEKFEVGTPYIVRVWKADDEEISGTSDPFVVTN